VQSYPFNHRGINYVLVDTPGFDDSNRSVKDVFNEIARWLENTYRQSSKLNGIIYLHSIAGPRMQGSANRSLNIFKQLCVGASYRNVVIGTSFWASVSDAQGSATEREMRSKPGFFKEMFDQGAAMVRISGTDQFSNLKILEGLAEKTSRQWEIQIDTLMEHEAIDMTASASIVFPEVARLRKEIDERIADIRLKNRKKIEDLNSSYAKRLAEKRAIYQERLSHSQNGKELIVQNKKAKEFHEKERIRDLEEDLRSFHLKREQETRHQELQLKRIANETAAAEARYQIERRIISFNLSLSAWLAVQRSQWSQFDLAKTQCLTNIRLGSDIYTARCAFCYNSCGLDSFWCMSKYVI
jgi:hypothetical protein